MKKAKYLFLALAIALAGVFQLGGEANALSTYKNIRQLKTGDIIYFDNSGTNWNEVRVYLFSKSGGSERFNWDSRPTMTQIGETGVYKYEITNDLNIENYKDDHIIFSDNARHQTIDLGFIETGYAYLVDSEEGGKAKGYWYVYDKSELVDFILLQQDAFDSIDCQTPLERQKYMLDLVLKICDRDYKFERFEKCVSFFKNLINIMRQMNFSEFHSEQFNKYQQQLQNTVENAS